MAGPVDKQAAMDTVNENFGLTADDLGMDRANPFEGMNFGEDGGDDGDEDIDINSQQSNSDGDFTPQPEPEPQPQKQLDDLSVSHTPERGIPKNSEVRPDAKGNLVNQHGKIVAFAGREARLYQEHHKLKQQVGQISERANAHIADVSARLQKAVDIGMTMHDQLRQAREQVEFVRRAGLNDQQHRMAVEMAAKAQTDPVGVLKDLLTRAAASGIDLSSLGLQPGGFDPSALMKLVRDEINQGTEPVRQRMQQETTAQQQQREQSERAESAKRELGSFLAENPEAKSYLPVFQKIYSNPATAHLSLSEVWARLQLNLMRRGIDPKTTAFGQRPQQQQRSPNPQQRRLPSGRGNPPSGGRGRMQAAELAPVSESYEDIVRGLLTTQG